jgi:ABC-type amino acid transport system permease subunit
MKLKSKYIHVGITILFYLSLLLFINYRFGYSYDWTSTSKYYPVIIKGWSQTLLLTFVSLFFSLIIGLILFFMKKSSITCLKYISKVFNELMFGTPAICQVSCRIYFHS